MRKFVSLIAVAMLFCILAAAQTRQISGKVTSPDGTPVEGATILLKGSKAGTSTDAHGNFTINAKPGSTLIVTALNFKAQQVLLNDKFSGNILLEESQCFN